MTQDATDHCPGLDDRDELEAIAAAGTPRTSKPKLRGINTAHSQFVRGGAAGIDATTLDANARLRSFARRNTGENRNEFLVPPTTVVHAFA